MNTGIQDAANLGWKLAAALAGPDSGDRTAREALLDSYHDERHPIGRRVVRQSGAMLRAITVAPRPARLLRDLLAPRVLGIDRVSDAIAGSFTGLSLRYPRGAEPSPLVGTRADIVPLVGTTVARVQRGGDFALVRTAGRPEVDLPRGVVGAVREDDGPALLVRPDGYVAWAGRLDDGPGGWRGALARWGPGSLESSPSVS